MAAQPEPWPRLSRDLEQMREDIKRLQQSFSSFLSGMGLSVPASGVAQVDGSLVVQNGEAKSGNYASGSAGWHLGNDGNAEFNALTLRAGIVGNGALTNPVTFDGNGGATTNFAIPTTSSVVNSVTNVVPAGITKMASFVTGSISGFNGTAAADYLFASCAITGNGTTYLGNSLYDLAAAGAGVEVSCAKYGILTGLTPGTSVVHDLRARAQTATWPASTATVADLQVLILWGA
ncbi:MAG: hypothetical protein ACXVXZ_13055 [Mycobacteriaceae bacterium]